MSNRTQCQSIPRPAPADPARAAALERMFQLIRQSEAYVVSIDRRRGKVGVFPTKALREVLFELGEQPPAAMKA